MLATLFTTTSERIEPVLAALVAAVRRSKFVNVYDAKVLILDPKAEGRPRVGRIWVAIGDRRIAWYFATPSWRLEDAGSRLGALAGTVQGDGSKGFRRIDRLLRIRLAGWLSHLQRMLRQALLAKDPRAAVDIGLVQGLYRVEDLARTKKVDVDGILALRESRLGPIKEALERWAREVASSIEPESPPGRA